MTTTGRRYRPVLSSAAGLLLAMIVALGLAAVVMVAHASPASAAPAGSPPPAPVVGSAGVACPAVAATVNPNGVGLLDKLMPGQGPADRPGCFPTSAYRIDYHQGNILSASDNILGFATDVLFGATRYVVAIGLWIVDWAFTFGFAGRLAQPAADIAGRYQANIGHPLVGFVLTLTAAYAGFHIFRGRLGKGAGEFGLSLFVVAFATSFIISQPKMFLSNSLRTTGELSGAVVSLAVNCGHECDTVRLGACPPGTDMSSPPPNCSVPADQVSGSGDPSVNPGAAGPVLAPRAEFVFDQYRGLIRPLERGIHQAFIEKPYQLLQWGQTVPPGPCTDRMNQILARSPNGSRNKIIHVMANGEESDGSALNGLLSPLPIDAIFGDTGSLDGKCDAMYKFNRQPSMERLMVAALALLAATIVIVLLVLVAGTVVAAQLAAVAHIALTPLAVLGGALPGAGRQALWRWVAGFARAMMALLLMSAFLAFLLVTAKAVFDSTSAETLLMQMAALDMVTVIAFAARKKMLTAGHRITTNFGQRLGAAPIGGHKVSWMAPAAVGGATGFALAQHMREVSAEGGQMSGPLSRTAGRRFHNREQARAISRALAAAGGNQTSRGGQSSRGKSSGKHTNRGGQSGWTAHHGWKQLSGGGKPSRRGGQSGGGQSSSGQ